MTNVSCYILRMDHISIHTSAREVTPVYGSQSMISLYFNPHFRKGSDGSRPEHKGDNDYFNPHFRKGSDAAGVQKIADFFGFQSTLPQGK